MFLWAVASKTTKIEAPGLAVREYPPRGQITLTLRGEGGLHHEEKKLITSSCERGPIAMHKIGVKILVAFC